MESGSGGSPLATGLNFVWAGLGKRHHCFAHLGAGVGTTYRARLVATEEVYSQTQSKKRGIASKNAPMYGLVTGKPVHYFEYLPF